MTPGSGSGASPGEGDPLLGSGHGLDHFVIAVSDLAAASQDFRERLGFTPETVSNRFPQGMESRIIRLHENEYLELFAIYDPQSGHSDIAEIQQFLRRGEGAVTFGIRVSSAEETATHLRRQGFRVGGPVSGTAKFPGIDEVPPVRWKFVGLMTGEKFLDSILFFIEYVREGYHEFRARHPELPDREAAPPSHRNSALRGLHPWLAVAQLSEVVAAYERVGFSRIRRTRFDRLKSDAVELRVGQNSLVIVGGPAGEGPVPEYLRQRDSPYGLMGISVGVRSLETALAAIQPHVATGLETQEGLFGKSVVVPPESAHGIWLELFESGSSER